MKKTILILNLFVCALFTQAQIKPLDSIPFVVGEHEKYQVRYQWGFLDIKAGLVEFNIDTTQMNDEACFHFKSIGNSIARYDWIYKVRDTFQSVVRKRDFQPLFYERKTSEGSYNVLNRTFFKEDLGLIEMELFNTTKGSSFQSFPLEEEILDLQTAVYYARLLDYSNAYMSEEYEFTVIIDGQVYEIPIRYEGTETITLNKTAYPCFRISTQVIEGTIFKSHQTIKIWVTQDGSQVPVKVEAPIIVGEVRAELIRD